MFQVALIDSFLGIIISQPFQTLFGYNKSMEPVSSLNVLSADNPATVKATPSMSGPSHRDDHPPVDPLAGLQAGNASGAQPGGVMGFPYEPMGNGVWPKASTATHKP